MNDNREYKYDNLKFIMIFLVVFAHFLELFNGEYKRLLYIFIYTFHMPMFVYISGYFSKGSKKHIVKFIYIYIIWQTIYFLVDKFILKLNLNLNYSYPNWVLWYIFALIIWNFIIHFFKKVTAKYCIIYILLAFLLSILVGFINSIGYAYSLSRIITFFPYFLIGYFDKKFNLHFFDLKKQGKTNVKKTVFYFTIALISISYFITISKIQELWLYGSYSYFYGGYNCIFKIMWILFSMSQLFMLNNIVTNSKISVISKIGSNTLFIYLIYGIILKILRLYSIYIFGYNEFFNISLSLIYSIVLLILLGNNFIKEELLYLTNFNKIAKVLKK